MSPPLQRATRGLALVCLAAFYILTLVHCPAQAASAQADKAFAAWLSDLRLSKFMRDFADLGVYDLSDVAFVQPADLDDMGMKRIPRRKFLQAQSSLAARTNDASDLRSSSSSLPPAAATIETTARRPRQSSASSLSTRTKARNSNDWHDGKRKRERENTNKKKTKSIRKIHFLRQASYSLIMVNISPLRM